MARWDDVAAAEPAFAEAVQSVFDAHKHKTLATLRADGSPRISGTEATFAQGDLWLGSMGGSMKARDLQRDPRMALHSATIDLELQHGDAKISGRAEEIHDADRWRAVFGDEAPPPDEAHMFRIDVTDVVLTRVEGELLVIDSWSEGRGMRRVERR
jgi:hypothetical protein